MTLAGMTWGGCPPKRAAGAKGGAMTTALLGALHRLDGFGDVRLEAMPVAGVAHEHLRIGGRGLVVRMARWSQVALDPVTHLAAEAAGFERAAASGHTPALHAVLAVSAALPRGALVVREVVGRCPVLPDDLARLARALAAIHRLPVPACDRRPPLASPTDSVGTLAELVERQCAALAGAGLAPAALGIIGESLDVVQRLRGAAAASAVPGDRWRGDCLIVADCHPGNFLVDAEGRAWFLDLERAAYGSPAIDLAHATLPTSTTWPECGGAILTSDEVAFFYRTWADSVSPALLAAAAPWLVPVRRAVWLRTLGWMARWRYTHERDQARWLPVAMREHISARIADSFTPATLGRVSKRLDSDGAAIAAALAPRLPWLGSD